MPSLKRMSKFLLAVAACATLAAAPAATAAKAPSLRAFPTILQYSKGEIVLSGVVPSGRAGETVTILSQACRFTELAEIGSVKSGAGGAFRYRVQPMLNTTFRVRINGVTSNAVNIRVKPLIELRRVKAGRFRVEISTTNPVFLNGKPVVIERKAGRRWASVKRVRLVKASTETAITVLSAATFTTRVSGVLRARLPQASATCYVGVTSNSTRA